MTVGLTHIWLVPSLEFVLVALAPVGFLLVQLVLKELALVHQGSCVGFLADLGPVLGKEVLIVV